MPIDINLRDTPSRELLLAYKEKFSEINVTNVLLYLDFQKVGRDLSKNYDAFIETFQLTEAKFTLMMLLYRENSKSLTPVELSKKAGVKKATITGLLAGLEKSEFIIREKNKNDGRSTIIVLSKKGIAKLKEFLPYNYSKANRMMDILSDIEKENLQLILNKIKEEINDE